MKKFISLFLAFVMLFVVGLQKSYAQEADLATNEMGGVKMQMQNVRGDWRATVLQKREEVKAGIEARREEWRKKWKL